MGCDIKNCKCGRERPECDDNISEKEVCSPCKSNRYVFRINFPHTSLGPVYTAIKDYVNKYCFPFRTNIYAPFDKSMQQIRQRRQDVGIEAFGAEEPIFVYSPQLYNMEKSSDMPRNFMNEHPVMNRYFMKYQHYEDGTFLSFVPNRMIINCPFRIFTESKIQVDDLFLRFNNVFRNKNKWMYLEDVFQLVLIDNEMKLKTHEGEKIFNWKKAFIGDSLIPSLGNQNWSYIPIRTKPFIRMTSLTDESNFYGGTDLPEHALAGNFEIEAEIPIGLVVNVKLSFNEIDWDFIANDEKNDDNADFGNGLVVIEKPGPDSSPEHEIIQLIECTFYEYWSDESEYPFILDDISFNLNNFPFIVFLNGSEVGKSKFKVIDEHTIHITGGPEYEDRTKLNFKVCNYKLGFCRPPLEESQYHKE